MGGRLCGLVALAAFSFHPSGILYSNFVASEPLFTFLLLLGIWLFTLSLHDSARQDRHPWLCAMELIGMAAVLAFASFIRPMAVIFLVAAIICMLPGRKPLPALPKNDVPLGLRLTCAGWKRCALVCAVYFAFSSLFTMGTYAAGDIMERSKDGVYDLQDYSGTLLNTGITGMGSLASGLTGGLVKVDTKRSGYIFDYTIEKTQNWIKDTAGDSTLGRALLLPAGAVYATATGICGTFVDCGVQIGESIKKFWQGKNYTPNDSMEYLRYINQREGAYGFGYSESGGGGFR